MPFKIPFESDANRTVTYHEAIGYYQQLAKAFPNHFRLAEVGDTDAGYPLHVAVLSMEGVFEVEKARQQDKTILLINNGIHPGEPEGIDATIMLFRDLLTHPERQAVLKNLVIVAIPVYNIDGCLNRNSYSRVNQDGPASYGFRANDRNLDLNRDFVKTDSRNARSFNLIFRTWDPDVFVDNHTSNGADYQYTMTLISTQSDKLEEPLGKFLRETMNPALYTDMKARHWEMIPYVDSVGETPDTGLLEFCDYGRYSTGYAAFFNTIGFMPETHMLKPFADRLWSNYAFMESVLAFLQNKGTELKIARKAAKELTKTKKTFTLDWSLDNSRPRNILFKGYAAKHKPSAVSGLPRLWYDRKEPFEKEVAFFDRFNPSVQVEKPYAYILPQAWTEVIAKMHLNKVKMYRLAEDRELEVEQYFITGFDTRNAWEGHYFHHNTKMEKQTNKRTFRQGDYIILVNQACNRYIVETIEPQAPDSWFAWNFFDAILAQKEYFSAYVFEDLAEAFLQDNPSIKAQLEAKKASDESFAKNSGAQLDWVYRQSPHFWERVSHNRYPIARLMHETKLLLDEHY